MYEFSGNTCTSSAATPTSEGAAHRSCEHSVSLTCRQIMAFPSIQILTVDFSGP